MSCVMCLSARTITSDTIANRLWQQVVSFPQEKLYTQIDRAEYVIGDTIWMRHHVVDALTGLPSLVSRYVYVELVNPFGCLVQRVMMRQDAHGAIYGYIPTSSTMPSGQYLLRAYTRYMADATPQYLFTRPLKLRNIMEGSVKITTTYRGGMLELSFADPKSGAKIRNGSVKITSSQGDVAFTGSTDKTINIHSIDVGRRQRCLLVEVGNYQEYIPISRESVDIQLMPEGGHLVMGKQCRVAYKVLASTGLGLDMSAVVTDDNGTVVAENHNVHCGMGVFSITPQVGHSYKMACMSADGQSAEAALPKAVNNVPALAVTQNSSAIIVKILAPTGIGQLGRFWLVSHQNGAPLYARQIDNTIVKFSRSLYRDGIAHFLLTDQNMNIISERMVFVCNGCDVYESPEAMEVVSSGNGKLHVNVSLPDSVTADCAISITDGDSELSDTVNNIVSTLLLSEELRGNIEQPAWYFSDHRRSGQLDLLMMTQAWRRYDLQKTLNGSIEVPSLQQETSMSISGKVTSNMSSRGKKGASVVMLSNRGGLVDAVCTDDMGRFRFDGFEMYDSTGYMIMSRSANGSDNVALRVDSLSYPVINDDIPQSSLPVNYDNVAMQKAVARLAKWQGGRTVFLPEVTVETHRSPRTTYEGLTKISGTTIRYETLRKNGYKSIVDVLREAMIAGIMYDSGNDWFTYRLKPVYLIVDGMLIGSCYDSGGTSIDTQSMIMAYIHSLKAKDVYQVDVVKGLAVNGLPGLCGISSLGFDQCAFVITTNRESELFHRTNVRLVKLLGYQRPAAFYNPKYVVPDDYNLRQTIYWNPSVQVENGKAQLEFLPNGAKDQRIVIEGVDRSGKIIHLQQKCQYSKTK